MIFKYALGIKIMEFGTVDLTDILTIFALILGPALAAGLVIWRDEKLQKRRTNKMVLMLARDLQYMSERVSALHRDFEQSAANIEAINNMNKQSGNNFDVEGVAFAAFTAWRDGLSLEMWKAFRYELDPEPYECLLEAYKIIEYIIKGKNSIQNGAPIPWMVERELATGLLVDFNNKYAELSKVCKYYSTV